jgi:hypothetical protein
MVVKLRELSGTQSKNPIFNSVAKILKIGKSIENHRKLRIMQTQFCWIPDKNYYNCCYSYLSCFLIVVALKIEM